MRRIQTAQKSSFKDAITIKDTYKERYSNSVKSFIQ